MTLTEAMTRHRVLQMREAAAEAALADNERVTVRECMALLRARRKIAGEYLVLFYLLTPDWPLELRDRIRFACTEGSDR